MPNLEDAEGDLKRLEQFRHAAAMSHRRMKRAERYMYEHGDDPEKMAAYKAEMEQHAADKAAALKAHADAGITERQIDTAAQAVLDARGEAHTDQAFKGGKDYVAQAEVQS